MEIKEIKCYKCLKCATIYISKEDAYNCKCNNKCSDNISGFHSWIYLHSFKELAFYKCKKCGMELIGKTHLQKESKR